MIYNFVPLYAIGIITRVEIDQFETSLIRKELKLPPNIPNKLLDNIATWYRDPISSTINKVYQQHIMKFKYPDPLPINSLIRNNHKEIILFKKDELKLIAAINADKTHPNYYH